MVFLVLFVAYLGISIYHNDPSWTTQQMIAQPAGRAAVALESVLMIMMFGQVRHQGVARHLSSSCLCVLDTACDVNVLTPLVHQASRCTGDDTCCSENTVFMKITRATCHGKEQLPPPAAASPVTSSSFSLGWLMGCMCCLLARQAADEIKQMLTYRKDYFTSPWNYMDVASCLILAILFLLHITRLSNQVGGGEAPEEAFL
jgi:hypothetical protein